MNIDSECKTEVTQGVNKYQYVTSKMEPQLVKFSMSIRRLMVEYGERKNIKRKKKLIHKVKLSTEQEKQIQDFYLENYGKKIKNSWHRLYQSYMGIYRYDYFPEILLSTKLEPLWNPYREAELFGDKNLLETLFGSVEGVRIPKTILSCVKGIMRNEDCQLIEFEDACNYLFNIGDCVIKKTVETNSGRGICICNLSKGRDSKTGLSIEALLIQFGDNFVVQELIQQSEQLSKLNASSLNTFRIMTYILDGKIYHCPVGLRLGRSNADRDNIHYGGIAIGVDEEGLLREKAFSEFGEEYLEHPDSHVLFSGFKVLEFHKLIEVAYRLHERIPYLGLISWDLSIDGDGTPVLIEMNTIRQAAWFPQMINGEPLFRENTAKVLRLIGKKG